MLQIYLPKNSNYDQNGDSFLNPLSATFRVVLNGEWIVEIEHPIDDKAKYIVENAVLKADTPEGKGQLFRIKNITKTNTIITAIAEPIALDSAKDCFLFDVRPTNKNGQQALDIIFSNSKYRGHSNIKNINTSYFIRKNAIEAISSDDGNSFINRWGGEVHYHNFDITVNDKLGTNLGVKAQFGLNITGINIETDTSDIATRIVPVGYDGITLDNNGYIESSNVNKYPNVYFKTIEYNDVKVKNSSSDEEGFNTLKEAQNELIKRAKKEFENGIDIPKIKIEIDMIDVSKTSEYKDVSSLLNVHLGDVIECKYTPLDINVNKRVVEYAYDLVRQEITNIILGDKIENYFDKTSSIIASAEKVIDTGTNTIIGDRIKGVLDAMQTGLRAQKSMAQKQDVRAVLFEDLVSNSPTFGATCLGTKGIEFSNRRNAQNTDWIWSTAVDANGVLAPAVITGVLADSKGNNYWDLDTGELVSKKATLTEAVITGAIKGGTINIGNKFKVDSNGNVTVAGDGEFKGTVTGSTIKGGSITGSTIKTDKDLTVGNNVYIGSYGDRSTKKNIYLNDSFAMYTQNDAAIFGRASSSAYDNGTITVMRTGAMHIKAANSLYMGCGSSVRLENNAIYLSTSPTITSDARKKYNIRDIETSWINELEIKSYDLIDGATNQIGIIAQNYIDSKCAKYFINKDTDGNYSVCYGNITNALIKYCQQLEKRISILEEKLKERNE